MWTGSGIAPFFPVTSQPAGIYLPVHIFLFVLKLPIFITVATTYFVFLQWLPLGSLAKKAMLWMILGIPGIWWIDLQIDGVKKGSLARGNAQRVPQPSNVIASSFTSPIDSLYLAAIFDPIFTVSYPHTRQVEYISLLGSIFRALRGPQEYPPPGAKLTDLKTLVAEHPKRVIVVFPECSTTNGRGILPLSPSLLTVPPTVKIFPVNLRYTPPDITTPVPGAILSFVWNLLSQPTHCIRVRIADVVYNGAKASDAMTATEKKERYLTNFLDTLGEDSAMTSSTDTLTDGSTGEPNSEERRVLDKVGEALARLGRVKRVGLTLKDKAGFINAWSKKRR
jgi:1-acyl-sn-glycerol-3-phosphate acyltransferase